MGNVTRRDGTRAVFWAIDVSQTDPPLQIDCRKMVNEVTFFPADTVPSPPATN
jgi:hypothetical protein